MDAIEHELTTRLQTIDDVVLPVGDPEGDVRRGRQRLRRRRIVAIAGSAAAVAVVAVGALGLSQLGQGPGAAPTTPPVLAPPAEVSPTPTAVPGCFAQRDAGSTGIDPAVARQLDAYRDVLARHLDPGGAHLESGEITGSQSSTEQGDCPEGQVRYLALGTKLGWSVKGSQGLGMVQVEVSTPGDEMSQVWASMDGWRPHAVTLPGVRSVQVAEDESRKGVLVEREDGSRVGLLVDDLFGNNSLVPTEVDLDLESLVRAAADPGLRLK